MNPYIQMRMANKARGAFEADGATLWLYDAIAYDDEEAAWLGGIAPRAFISALSAVDGPVTLRINSPGGSVWGAQAMVAAMRDHAHPITARIDSLAASAATVIAAEAARVEIQPGAMMMIHKAFGLVMGNADAMLDAAARFEKIDGAIAGTYARKAGGDPDEWMARMSAETWFTAEEAVEAGLADALAEAANHRAAAKWDLSAYAAPPAPEEPTAAANRPSNSQTRMRFRAAACALI